ncbi:MAG TPA: ubiquitin-activating E1 FCCH domain-containing protein [Saprospiraceae bacterium]|nr:ubiquitin-activating E1 FCCH domain-containing protein [Saprospiraceae bacterium]
MNLLSDVITYIRRIIKSPSNAQITDSLLIDYINRFWIMDVDARIQLFDLNTQYQFQTVPGFDQYNMPLYAVQSSDTATTGISENISYYPVYQGFIGTAYINGIQVPLQTQKNSFFNIWTNVVQQMNVVVTGDGTAGPYNFTFPIAPNNQPPTPLNIPLQYILRGHVDVTGIIELTTVPNYSTFADPPVVTSTQAQFTIPGVPVANEFPAVYITSIASDGESIVVCDSGQFLSGNQNYGLLMKQGQYPNGNTILPGGYDSSAIITGVTQANPAVLTAANSFVVGQEVAITGVVGMTELNGNTYTIITVTPTTITIDVDSTLFTPYVSGGIATSNGNNLINYFTGEVNVIFPKAIPAGVNINAQCFYFQSGLPRGILFNNNTLTFRSPPDRQYLVQIDAYLSPAGYLATNQAVKFAYMAEYIARGAARKILSDTGDIEQFQFYEPLFREQEQLVWKRSQRQFTSDRTQTLYSQGLNQGQSGFNNLGSTL